MTWFGVVYLVLSILGVLIKIGTIGKPRDPVDAEDALLAIVVTGLILWGLFAVGVTH